MLEGMEIVRKIENGPCDGRDLISITPNTEHTLMHHTMQVVFGEVLEGMEIVRKIENGPCDGRDRPTSPTVIAAAGEL